MVKIIYFRYKWREYLNIRNKQHIYIKKES